MGLHQTDDKGNEQALVEAFAGNEAIFDEIYRIYSPRVRAVCRRYLNDPRDVEEAVQDTFTKAYVNLSRFNGAFRLGAWLARIAANAALDLARRNQRRLEVVVPDAGEQAAVAGTEAADLDSPVDDVLVRMPPNYARALSLRGEGASHAEIGSAFGKSPQQAKALLHRARESFRRFWRELGGRAAFAIVATGAFTVWRISRAGASSTFVRAQAVTAAETIAAPTSGVANMWPLG